MSLQIASINSGSNANCYYVGNEKDAVLIDAGLSCRETLKRLKRLELNVSQIKALFISHEHNDHIRGIEGIADKLMIPIYITPNTLQASKLKPPAHLLCPFVDGEAVSIGSLTVLPFRKQHDAVDAHSFTVTGNGVSVGILTDIGAPCSNVATQLAQCHAAFLEANYDDEMLWNGPYSHFLKQRVSSDYGHLSNRQAAALVAQCASPAFRLLILSHLSVKNNTPEKALAAFAGLNPAIKVTVASRYGESEIYTITANPAKVMPQQPAKQLSFY
ncbi:MAG: MBL fold metallo-hydrolase [Chitinophagia bacterium]|nr:MBL fold metallo-hydrolase [Chitinophagia bacterium]